MDVRLSVDAVCLKEKHVNLAHIESRRSKRISNEVEIYAECSCTKKEFNELVQHLKDHVNIVSYNTPQHVWSSETGTSVIHIQICIWNPNDIKTGIITIRFTRIVFFCYRLFGLCVCFGWIAGW